jgi:hypothetical protein
MANSKRKCKQCRNFVPVCDGVIMPIGFFCKVGHALDFANDKQQKARERQIKASKQKERKDTRLRKESIKTAGEYIKEAQASINKYIRMRDHGRPCISCGSSPEQKIGGSMDAGHYRSRGSAGHLRFNVFNIHAQCVKCNRFGSGNAVDYRIELIKRIGFDRVERLEQDNEYRKFTIDYLKRAKRIFNKRARFYEKRITTNHR